MTHPSSSTGRPARCGLTRAEALWAFLLFAAVTVTILGTLRHELSRTRLHWARDTMEYLAGNLRLALGKDCAAWPPGHPALLGPGAPPAGAPAGPEPLAAVLPPDFYLPADPWGHAFLVRWVEVDGRPAPRLICAGPTGHLGAPNHLELPILPPRPGSG